MISVKKLTALFCVEWWSEQIIGTLRFVTTRLRFDFELESYHCFLGQRNIYWGVRDGAASFWFDNNFV